MNKFDSRQRNKERRDIVGEIFDALEMRAEKNEIHFYLVPRY